MERLGNEELWMDLEHEQRLTAVEERSKSNSHRLDKLEESNEVISRLATSRRSPAPPARAPALLVEGVALRALRAARARSARPGQRAAR